MNVLCMYEMFRFFEYTEKWRSCHTPKEKKIYIFESIFFSLAFRSVSFPVVTVVLLFFSSLFLCSSLFFQQCDDVVDRYWFLFICFEKFIFRFMHCNKVMRVAKILNPNSIFFYIFRPYWQFIMYILKFTQSLFFLFWIRTEHTNYYNWIWMHTDIHRPIRTHTHTRDTSLVFSNFFHFFAVYRLATMLFALNSKLKTWQMSPSHTFDGDNFSETFDLLFCVCVCLCVQIEKEKRKLIFYLLEKWKIWNFCD